MIFWLLLLKMSLVKNELSNSDEPLVIGDNKTE